MTKFSKTSVIAILATSGALLLAGAAVAHGPAGGMERGPKMVFSQLDGNGDGQITAEEFAAFKASRVGDVDADGDGFLTAEELAAAGEARRAERMQDRQGRRFEMLLSRADANDDGQLSVEEFLAFMEDRQRGPQLDAAGLPEGWDANGDGSVSAEEFETALADMAGKGFGKRGEHGERGEHGRGRSH